MKLPPLPIKVILLCFIQSLLSFQHVLGATLPTPTPTPAVVAPCTVPPGFTAIRTASEFSAIRNNPSAQYFLCNDIILNSDFIPIPLFSGVLKGNYKRILNLRLIQNLPRDLSQPFRVGLFEIVQRGIISDLTIDGAEINSRLAHAVGFLAGYAEISRFKNIIVRNSILLAEMPIISLYPIAEAERYHGGIVGVSVGSELTNVDVMNDVFIEGPKGVGGIVGKNGVSSSILLSRSYAQVSVEISEAGGIAAYNQGRIERSFSTGLIKGSELVGGIVGVNFGDAIDQCYSAATVQGSSYIGGIAGVHLLNVIKNSFSAANVVFSHGAGMAIGGFVGLMDSSDGVRIENSYSISLLKLRATSLEPQTVGSFVGDVWSYESSQHNGLVVNSYFDRDKNPGLGSLLGQPKSANEMKTFPYTYDIYKEWNFASIWTARNGQYPRLRF